MLLQQLENSATCLHKRIANKEEPPIGRPPVSKDTQLSTTFEGIAIGQSPRIVDPLGKETVPCSEFSYLEETRSHLQQNQ